MTEPWYITREAVKAALDVPETARSNTLVDRSIGSGSRAVEGLTHRRFYPELAVRYFDWPNGQYAMPWRLWLGPNELISVSAVVVAGVTLADSDFILRRSDDRDEPPYTHVEINLASSAAFSAGDTHQRQIAITGSYGHSADEAPAGTLAEALDASETSVDVSDSAAVGIGDIIRAGDERMIVTGKSQLDTGQNLAGDLTAQAGGTTVSVASGTAFTPGETILIGGERMLIEDIAGNTLIVKRAWDGSTLAAHSTGADIYAPRTLVVERGALGTTAAAHDSAAVLYRHEPPSLVRQLALAEALNNTLQATSSYARLIGGLESQKELIGRGLADLRDQVRIRYARGPRLEAV
ncbi:hypothetical protein J5X84_36140 [Streptosporangiaceae bacterium NEAU-GS5]|nr:hypothetical protein [Streptosporangiaceae bacterium NEAU-GS5]